MTDSKKFAQAVLDNIAVSPTPFHAVENMTSQLLQAGYQRLEEKAEWDIQAQGKYFVTRNDSSLIAFSLGSEDVMQAGVRMLGVHTDSPCLKVKPQPNLERKNYVQLGVEVYGGVLLNPWFDRDLSLAGRVSFVNQQGQVESVLLDCKRALAVIPSLAIHLDREANSGKTVNAQTHLPPVIALDTQGFSFEEFLRSELEKTHSDLNIGEVIDYEMSLYDVQAGRLLGVQEELLCSARLDNLLSCFVGLQSLLQSGDKVTSFLVCTDHEEVGSSSACGAQGPMLENLLQRVFSVEELPRIINRSMMVSVDNAHAVHPNYMGQHEPEHMPLLNHGPVLKVNANQRYASNSETQTVFAHCCKKVGVNLQRFVTRSDLGCGSTIGPITASSIGVPTVDVGVPTLGMHSIRETAGSKDLLAMSKALTEFLNEEKLWV